MTYTSQKGKEANAARARGLAYRAARNANIKRRDGTRREYCGACGADVGVFAVMLSLGDYLFLLCRDCAKRVGELVNA